MKKARFYYSEDLKLSNMEVVLGQDKQIVAVGDLKGSIKNLPRITICGIYDNEAQTMSFGIARCSAKDAFKKDVGRVLSLERAENNPVRVVNIYPAQKISDVFMTHAVDLDLGAQAMQYPIKFNKMLN